MAGQLTFLDNAVADATGTVQLRATVDNHDRRLWPGPAGQGAARASTIHNAPCSCRRRRRRCRPRVQFVYVVKDDSTAELRLVKTGQPQGDLDRHRRGRQARREGRHQRPARRHARRARSREASAAPAAPAAPAAGQERPEASHEPLRALHPPAGHDRGPDRRGGRVRRSPLPRAARSTTCRRWTIRSSRCSADYPGASPETVANNIATPLERQFMQINGLEVVTSNSTQGNTTLTLQFALDKIDRRRRHRRADGHLPGDREPARGPALAADVLQDEPERSADHVHRADERLGHAGPALRLRQHAGRPAHQHPAPASPRGGLRHEVGDPHQGGPRRDVGAPDLRRRPLGRDPERHELHGAGQLDSAGGTVLLRPQGQLDSARPTAT